MTTQITEQIEIMVNGIDTVVLYTNFKILLVVILLQIKKDTYTLKKKTHAAFAATHLKAVVL